MNDQAGHVRISAAAVLMAACLMAGPSVAMLPLYEACAVVGTDQRMSDGRQTAQAGPTELVTIEAVGDGFATWIVADGVGHQRLVLQHCPSGRELIVAAPASRADAVSVMFDEMVFGDAPYTLDQIADATQALGARVTQTRNTQGNCACLVLFGTE